MQKDVTLRHCPTLEYLRPSVYCVAGKTYLCEPLLSVDVKRYVKWNNNAGFGFGFKKKAKHDLSGLLDKVEPEKITMNWTGVAKASCHHPDKDQ